MQVTAQLNWICLSMTDFGKRLASPCKARQLTQIELANPADIQPRMVGALGAGDRLNRSLIIIKLAQLLEVSIDHLLLGEEGSTAPVFDIKKQAVKKELRKQVDELKADDQEVICRILDMAITQEKMKQVMKVMR